MRSEQEILEFLDKCREASSFGVSQGPCPLKASEPKYCLEDCPFDDPEFVKGYEGGDGTEEGRKAALTADKKECCEEWDKRRGCCAECSYPSAMEWVMGKDSGATDNGQKRLISFLGGLHDRAGTD